MQLHELHPALVHLPIALLPAALGADAFGRSREGLAEAGRLGIMCAAGSAALAALSGLVAQEEVEVSQEAHPLLVTHRSLNLAVLGLTSAMAVHRAGRERAGRGYLLLGGLGVATTFYSAWLGGRMVYEHGVGVKPAGGLAPDHAPALGAVGTGALLRRIARHVRHGLAHTLEHLREGEVVPALGSVGASPSSNSRPRKPGGEHHA